MTLFFDTDLIKTSGEVLIILSLGLGFYSCFLPFDFGFVQAGRPEIQSIAMLFTIFVAVILNTILIPYYGIIGAALATTATLIIAGITQCALLKIYRPFG